MPIVFPEPQGDSENQTDNNSSEVEIASQGGEVTQPADDMQSPANEQIMASSGRVVKLPNRLKDFVKH